VVSFLLQTAIALSTIGSSQGREHSHMLLNDLSWGVLFEFEANETLVHAPPKGTLQFPHSITVALRRQVPTSDDSGSATEGEWEVHQRTGSPAGTAGPNGYSSWT
jgi:hypothetical protein